MINDENIFFKKIFQNLNLRNYSPTIYELQEMEKFYSMLLRIEKKHPNFSAKRVVKKVYPNFFLFSNKK